MSSVNRQQQRREDRATSKDQQRTETEEQMAERASLLNALRPVPRDIPSPASKINPHDPYVVRLLQKCVRDTPVIQELHDELRTHPGVPSKLPVGTLFFGMLIANWETHTFLRSDISKMLNRTPLHLAGELGLLHDGDWWLTYKTYHKQETRLEKLLRESWSLGDFSGYANTLEEELMAATVPVDSADKVVAVAVDETPFKSWAVTQNYDVQKDVNKRVARRYRRKHGLGPRVSVPDMKSTEMRAIAAEMGYPVQSDGRLQRTDTEPDARSMHISATNKTSSDEATGYQTTKVVAVRPFTTARNEDKLTVGEGVGAYVLASHTYPGNTNCGPIADALLRRTRGIAKNVKHVIVDGGFADKEDDFVEPALREGFMLHRNYRSTYVHTHSSVVVDHSEGQDTVIESCGQVYHRWMPEHLRDVPVGLSGDDLASFQASRQKWAYDRERDKSLPKGVFRYRCPYARGKIYNEAIPHSVGSRRANARRVAIPEGETQCCNQCSFVDRELLFKKAQYPHYGTRAHQELMPKRNPVEGKFGEQKNRHGLISTTCRAKYQEPRLLNSIIIDAVHNLQKTLNKKIKALWKHQAEKRRKKKDAAARKDQQAPNDGREMAEPDGKDSLEEEPSEDSDDESSSETPTPPRAPP